MADNERPATQPERESCSPGAIRTPDCCDIPLPQSPVFDEPVSELTSSSSSGSSSESSLSTSLTALSVDIPTFNLSRDMASPTVSVPTPSLPPLTPRSPSSSIRSSPSPPPVFQLPSSPSSSASLPSDCMSPPPSVYSLTESLRESSFIHVHGRDINNTSAVYMLPADEEEIHRLDTQHNIFRELTGGRIYIGPVPEVLAPPSDDVPYPSSSYPYERKAVLDLGTGSGTWAMEISREFPHVDVVGVDLAPIQGIRDLPPNCRIEVDDINLGMEHFFDSFDVVHARHICAGIKSYSDLLSQIAQILRPGGIALMMEAEYGFYDAEKRYIPLPSPATRATRMASRGSDTSSPVIIDPMEMGFDIEEDPLYLSRFAAAFKEAVDKRGGDINASSQIVGWAKAIGAFDVVEQQDIWMPVSPWCKGNSPAARRSRRVGILIRDDLRSFLSAGKPLLISNGMPAAAVDDLIRRADEELDEARVPLFLRGRYTWARKAMV